MSVKDHNAVVTKLLAFNDGVVKKMPDMNMIEHKYDVEIYHHIFEGMKVNEYHTNLDGCGYVVAIGKSVDDAEERAANALDAIKREVFSCN